MLSAKTDTAEVVERGLAIYERDIASQLNIEDEGRFVAIDINTGEWEIDDTESVSDVLRARIPDSEIFLWRHPDIPRGFVRGFPPGMMKRLGIPVGILDEALE